MAQNPHPNAKKPKPKPEPEPEGTGVVARLQIVLKAGDVVVAVSDNDGLWREVLRNIQELDEPENGPEEPLGMASGNAHFVDP